MTGSSHPCAWCGRLFRVRADGTLWKHNGPAGTATCPGSRARPADLPRFDPDEVTMIGRRAMYYDLSGIPCSMNTWSSIRRNEDLVRVGSDRVAGYWISTVYVGIDLGFTEPLRPIIFETMVFLDKGAEDKAGLEEDCRSYATEEEARTGHAEMVTLLRSVLDDPAAVEPNPASADRSGVIGS